MCNSQSTGPCLPCGPHPPMQPENGALDQGRIRRRPVGILRLGLNSVLFCVAAAFFVAWFLASQAATAHAYFGILCCPPIEKLCDKLNLNCIASIVHCAYSKGLKSSQARNLCSSPNSPKERCCIAGHPASTATL